MRNKGSIIFTPYLITIFCLLMNCVPASSEEAKRQYQIWPNYMRSDMLHVIERRKEGLFRRNLCPDDLPLIESGLYGGKTKESYKKTVCSNEFKRFQPLQIGYGAENLVGQFGDLKVGDKVVVNNKVEKLLC